MDAAEFYEAVCTKLREEYEWDHSPDFFFVNRDFKAGMSVDESCKAFDD